MGERLFSLRGEIDVASASELHAALDDAITLHDGDVCVDCSELTFIDSSGLAVLVTVQRELQTSGRQLRITNVMGGPQRAIRVAGLTKVLGVNEDTDSHNSVSA